MAVVDTLRDIRERVEKELDTLDGSASLEALRVKVLGKKGELTALLSGRYAQGHFTEQLEEDAIFFDYRLRPGPAVTRNAIELLRIMGVEADVVDRARRRAAGYLDTGQWA